MKTTEEQKSAVRHSVRQYTANMAVEGLAASPEADALIEEMIEEGLSREDGQARMIKSLKARGLIPADADEVTFAAE